LSTIVDEFERAGPLEVHDEFASRCSLGVKQKEIGGSICVKVHREPLLASRAKHPDGRLLLEHPDLYSISVFRVANDDSRRLDDLSADARLLLPLPDQEHGGGHGDTHRPDPSHPLILPLQLLQALLGRHGGLLRSRWSQSRAVNRRPRAATGPAAPTAAPAIRSFSARASWERRDGHDVSFGDESPLALLQAPVTPYQ
jgi:hypothetical protein